MIAISMVFYYCKNLTEGRCVVGSDKLPTAALGLDVRGAAAATRWRAGAKASAAWAKEVRVQMEEVLAWNLKSRIFFMDGAEEGCRYVKNLNNKPYFLPSGTVTKRRFTYGERRVRTSVLSTLKMSSIRYLEESSPDCPPKPFLVSALVVLINYCTFCTKS